MGVTATLPEVSKRTLTNNAQLGLFLNEVNLPLNAKIKRVLIIDSYKISKFLCHKSNTQKLSERSESH